MQVKTPERDGYGALQVTYGRRDARRLTRPEAGHFAKASVDPGKRLLELRLDSVDGYEVGQQLLVDPVAAGSKVDVTAVSRGKGFAGTMKRHNFKGQGASHGNDKHHRAPGAIGSCAFPGRVFKGLRMAGHMGNEQVTTLNLEVVEADPERNLLLLKGSVPGPNGGVVVVRNAVKTSWRAERDGRDHPEDPLGHRRRQGPARRRRLRHPAQRGGDAPGRDRPARQPSGRDAHHEDPQRGPWWRRQAVPPEGHRQRPPGFDPLAALHWRRHRPRPEAALVRPADAEEDDQARAALGAVRPGREGKVLVVDDWGFDAPQTKDAEAALAALGLEGRSLVVVETSTRRRPLVPQPPGGAADQGQRAQRLRRPLQRLDRVRARATCPPRGAPVPPTLPDAPRGRRRAMAEDPAEGARNTTRASASGERDAGGGGKASRSTASRRRAGGRFASEAETDRRVRTSPMKDPRDIILAPVVSEKCYALDGDRRLHVQGSPVGEQARDPAPSRPSGASR